MIYEMYIFWFPTTNVRILYITTGGVCKLRGGLFFVNREVGRGRTWNPIYLISFFERYFLYQTVVEDVRCMLQMIDGKTVNEIHLYFTASAFGRIVKYFCREMVKPM